MNKVLLSKFNNRDISAFGEVYSLLYKELFLFSSKVYRECNEVEACDIVHDLFVKIWSSKTTKFDNIEALKGYCFTSIKNDFSNYIKRERVKSGYIEYAKDDSLIVTQLAETELIATVSKTIDRLPEECAKVFRLTLEGYSVKEIAKKFNKATTTIYTQKQDAIKTLKKLFKEDYYIILYILFNI